MLELNEQLVRNIVDNKVILITGGTGSFGNQIIKTLVSQFNPKKVIIFSRDEFKQFEMQKRLSPTKYPCLRYFLGDVRDYDRVDQAFNGVDIVFHAAALKQVPALEYNPTEAIKTNIYGTQNIIKAAINNNLEKVIGISTDKAVNPCNLYGATKLCFERLMIAANSLSGDGGPLFSVLRYGNVFGSRGSVVPIFLKQSLNNRMTITHKEMTRFTITLQEAINFVLNCASMMIGGEIFVPRLPSYNILQLADVINSEAIKEIIGIRPGEKIHELMISSNESRLTLNCGKFFVITPLTKYHARDNYVSNYKVFNPVFMEEGEEYSSGKNNIISKQRLELLIKNWNYKSKITH